jgi:serralysin
VADITFTESVDNATTVGDIRFAYSDIEPDAQAWAYLPGDAPKAGDIWFNPLGTSFKQSWTEGSYEFETVIHELGHALGLKHPFEMKPILPRSQDYQWNTVMSYSTRPGHQNWFLDYYPTTPMALDIQAMQYLYGANMTFHAGDDTYIFEQGSKYFETLWDAGGNDTLQYNATSKGGLIDLRPGHWSQLGQGIGVYDGHFHKVTTDFKTVEIYNTVIIENAIGSDFADKIYGNIADNRLTGGAGNDLLDGGDGADFLDGGLGKDSLIGGAGDDAYVIDNIGDIIIETSRTDHDSVKSSISYTLGKNLEDLAFDGSANLNGFGNGLDNLFLGNAGNNKLDGKAGNDIILGLDGNDTLIGGTGDDVIIGGTGNNRLTGGKGYDAFAFLSTPSLGSFDTITDFTKGIDLIYLDKTIFGAYLGITDFLSIETFPSTAPDAHLIFQTSTHSLYYDNDGSGSNVAQLFVVLTGKVNLDANDIILA